MSSGLPEHSACREPTPAEYATARGSCNFRDTRAQRKEPAALAAVEEGMIEGVHPPGLAVLVVEDEWVVRTSAVSALTEAGFTIVETDRTDEAIAHLRERARQIHALFTDVHVPGPMDGLALAHLSRRSWPWVHLLIVSGRAKPAAHELPDGARFLSKPYETDHVILHLREMAQALG